MVRGGTAAVLACVVALTTVSVAGARGAGATAAVATAAPPTPSGLTAKPGSSSQINLVWNAVTGAASYRIYRALSASGSFGKVGTSTVAKFSNTNLAAATTYYYSVQSVNSAGVASSPSGEVSAMTLPVAPSGIHATPISTSQINLTWNGVAGAVSYRVLRATVSGGPYTKAGQPTGNSLADIGLSPGTAYFYAIQAVDAAGGASAKSTELSATTLLSAPTGLVATTVSASEIDLTWNAVAGASSYVVQRGTASGGPYTRIATPTAASYANTGLSPGTTSFYVVQATNVSGPSAFSTEASAITVPGAPSGLAATALSVSQIQLTWTPTPGAIGYTVQRSTTSGGPYTTVSSPSAASYTDAGLSPGATYYYVVLASNSAGISPASAELAAATLPSAPVAVLATPVSASEIDLTWTAVAGATGYTVLRSTASGGPYSPVGSPASASFADTGLSPSTAYFYVVRAVDAAGPSSNTLEATALTLPRAPTGVVATAVSPSEIDLVWSAVPGATSYTVARAVTSGGPYTLVGSPASTTFANTGLAPGTTFYYVLRAINPSGPSVLSTEVSAITVPAAPAGVAAATISPSRIDLSWNAVTGASSYQVLRATASGGPYVTVGTPSGVSFSDVGLSSASAYYYVIEAVNASGSSAPSAQVSATTALATPTGVAAVAASVSQINLMWNAVTGATSYNVQRGTVSGGPYTTVGSPTGPSFSDSGLSPGTSYFYVVQAANLLGTSGQSLEVTAATLPAAPTGVAATTASASEIDLSWNAVTGATGYIVQRATVSGGPYTTVASPAAAAFANTGLASDTTYFYVVRAVDASGSSAASAQASASTVLVAPAGLVATAVSSSEIDLVWTAVAGATSYQIQRSTVSGGPYTTVGSPVTGTFANTGLAAGTTYFYIVKALNTFGSSAPSTEASTITVPAAPSGLVATTVSRSEIDLTWSAVAGATSYLVRRASVTGGPYATVGSPASASFADTGLSSNTAYFYVVEAVNGSGSSVPSAEVTASTVLPAPTGLVATAVSSSEIDLSWTAVGGATTYTVQRGTSSGGPYATVASPAGNSLADTGLTPGTTYFYVVEAVNGVGTSAASAQASSITVPGAPTGVLATEVSGTEIDLSWSAVAGATSYRVQRASVSGGPYASVGSPASASFADTGLSSGATYYYVVEAVNSSGVSAPSAEAQAVTGPDVPTGLVATGISTSEIDLTWNSVAGATSYTVRRASSSGGPYSTIGSPASTGFANTGLSPGATFFYVVQAVNAAGSSAPSAEAAGVTVPAAPTGLLASVVSASQISLTWNGVTGATGYTVQRATVSGGPYTTAGSPSSANFTDTGLSPATAYFYVIQAVNGSGASALSVEVTALTVPAAPSGVVAAAASASQINLTWSAVSGAAGYTVQRATTSGGPYTTVGSPASTSFADTGLGSATTYYYVVRATNASGASAASGQASATTGLAAPTGVTATAVSSSQINVAWTAVIGATSYSVERGTASGGPYTAIFSPSVNHLSDTGLSGGTTYFYVVQAVNLSGVSPFSVEVSAITAPAAPTGLVATGVSVAQINLTWGAVAGATSYLVGRGTASGGPYNAVGSPAGASFSDTGLSAGTTYFYVVQAVAPFGTSGRSAQAAGVTLPAVPSGVTATPITATQINLAWNAVAGATSYTVQRATVSGGPYTTIGSPTATHWSDIGLAADTAYFYVVQAADSSGVSASSSEVTATTLLAAPTGVSATPVSSAQINLTWNAVAGATSYTVERGSALSGPVTTIGSSVVTSFSDFSLNPATTYYYEVQAVSVAGMSALSSPVSGLTFPAAPTGVTATAVSGSEIDLSWTAVSGATGYTVQRSVLSGGPYTTVGSPVAASFADTGLMSATTYYYVVEAIGSSGASAASIQASATTTAAPPTGIVATVVSASAINLTWNAASGASGYNVQRATSAGGPYSLAGSPTSASFADTGLSPGTTYYYEVQSVIASGTSAFSAPVSGLTLPAAPTGLSASGASTSEIDLSWSAVSGATGYTVLRALSSGGPFSTIGSPAITAFTDTGLHAGTTYFYFIKAVNSSGSSALSVEVSAITIPAAPAGLAATAVSASQINLTWTAALGASSYTVLRATTSGGPYTAVGSTTTSPFSDSGLSAATTYYYVMQAVNVSGSSASSTQTSATTLP